MGKRAVPVAGPPSKAAKLPGGAESLGEDCPGVRHPMDRIEVSKMLGYLKYHAKPSNKNQGDRADAQRALEVYQGLGQEQKPSFLEAYNNHKGNLKWIYAFSQTEEEVEGTKVQTGEKGERRET